MKKVLSLLLAFVMVFSLASVALADDATEVLGSAKSGDTVVFNLVLENNTLKITDVQSQAAGDVYAVAYWASFTIEADSLKDYNNLQNSNVEATEGENLITLDDSNFKYSATNPEGSLFELPRPTSGTQLWSIFCYGTAGNGIEVTVSVAADGTITPVKEYDATLTASPLSFQLDEEAQNDATITLTVNNTGTKALTDVAVAKGSTQTGDDKFTIPTDKQAIAVGETKTFTLTLNKSAIQSQGTYSVELTVSHQETGDAAATTLLTQTVSIEVSAGEPNTVNAGADKTVTYGDADFTQAATNAVGAVTYESSDTGVATIGENDGVVKILKVGTTTIKAKAAGGTGEDGKKYAPGEDSYELTVEKKALTVDFGDVEGKKLSELTAELKDVLPGDNGKVTVSTIKWMDKDGKEVTDDPVVAKGDSYKYEITLTGDAAGNYKAEGELTLSSGGGIIISSGNKKPTEKPEEKPAPERETYVAGNPDGSFAPSRSITRGELATMLARLSKDYDADTSYSTAAVDVGNSFYTNPMNYMASIGVINGYTDGSIRPGDSCTRAEFATMLCRLLDMSPVTTARFSDVSANDWYAGYIGALANAGIISGYTDGTCGPDHQITRAEAVAMINRAFDLSAYSDGEFDTVPTDMTAAHWAYNEVLVAMNTDVSEVKK